MAYGEKPPSNTNCKRCEQSNATQDYNNNEYWVCDHCMKMLEKEFEDEYR